MLSGSSRIRPLDCKGKREIEVRSGRGSERCGTKDSLRQRELLKVAEEVTLEDRRSRQDLAGSVEDDGLHFVGHGESIGWSEYDRSKSIESTLLEFFLKGSED